MTANDSKPYLSYLIELVDQYNNTYHHSIYKKPINVDNSALNEKKMTQILSIRIFLAKVILKIGQEKCLLSILFWKLILALIKLKLIHLI